MEQITLDMVLREAQKLMETKPDETNHCQCRYVRLDGGHCVAGEILTNLGVSKITLMDQNRDPVGILEVPLDDEARLFLGKAQEIADAGSLDKSTNPTWKNAIHEAFEDLRQRRGW